MSKNKGFSFAGLVNPDAEPDAPEGGEQRGAVKRPVGRPKVGRSADAVRIAVTLEPDVYKAVSHFCIDHGVNKQEFLEQAIDLMLKHSNA